MAGDDGPRRPIEGVAEGRDDLVIVCIGGVGPPTSTTSISIPCRSRSARAAAERPGRLVVRGQEPVAGLPVEGLEREPDAVDGAMDERDVVRVRDEDGGHRGARLADAFERLEREVRVAAARRQLALGLLVHRPLGLGRHRARERRR